MNGLIGVLVLILTLVVAAAAFVFGTWVVVWNVNDIAQNGATFWNVFWILFVVCSFSGGASKAAA